MEFIIGLWPTAASTNLGLDYYWWEFDNNNLLYIYTMSIEIVGLSDSNIIGMAQSWIYDWSLVSNRNS